LHREWGVGWSRAHLFTRKMGLNARQGEQNTARSRCDRAGAQELIEKSLRTISCCCGEVLVEFAFQKERVGIVCEEKA